jgi:hypothetical protein
MRTRRGFGGRAGHFKPSKCGRRFRHTTSDLSSAFASFRSRVSNPSVNQSYTGAPSSRACRTFPWSRQKRARPDQARLEANSVAAMVAHSVARSRLPADGVPADTNNRHCRDHLNAVQVSVNPCAVRAFAVGDNLVRCIPIVFACPPKAPLTQAQARLEASFSRDYA